jgi:hypothetical protein
LQRRRGLIRACLSIGVAVLGLILVHRPLLVGFARLFRIDQPASSDALIVLNGSRRAAELYHGGLAPLVLLPATDPLPFSDLNPAALNLRRLIRNGVPVEVVQFVPTGGSAAELQDIAQGVCNEVRARPVRRITVLVTAHRSARTSWIFRKVLKGTGVEIRVAAVDNKLFDESNWYMSDEGLVAYFVETVEWLLLLLTG